MPSITNLRKALGVAERIQRLEVELKELLGADVSAVKPTPVKRKVVARRRKSKGSENLGHGLAPAVFKVLSEAGKPLHVKEILEGLTKGGYKFTSKKPLRVLGARIYTLKGVKKVGEGLFAPAS